MKALVVDDDALTRHIITRVLTERKHEVVALGDAETAWEACRREVFPLIVLDWVLPGMDGLQLCRRIRALPYGDSCVILMVTARDRPEDLTAILDAGAHDYLAKPIRPDLLRIRLAIAERLVAGLAERKRAIEELRKAKALAEKAAADKGRIVAAINAFFIGVDEDGTITEWTPLAESMFGLSLFSVIGRPLKSLEIDWEWGKVMDAVDSCRRTFGSMRLDRVRLKKPNGAEVFLKITAGAVLDDTSKMVILMGEDITERLRLEQQLRQSDKMASIGQLAAGVAHEINNPIGFIKSNLNALQEYVGDLRKLLNAYEELEGALEARAGEKPVQDRLRTIAALRDAVGYRAIVDDLQPLLDETKDGVERVRVIVQNLKEFSHADEGARKFANVNHCLQSTLKIVWNELKYKADVVEDYGALPEILCHPQELNQVFMNLLVNAAQAIKERGRILLRTFARENQVTVEVSDTGCGIPSEHLHRIFEPFFTTKDVGKGTGLGLSISYGLVQKHQGKIEVESTVGKGTTFRVILPVESQAVEEPQPAPS